MRCASVSVPLLLSLMACGGGDDGSSDAPSQPDASIGRPDGGAPDATVLTCGERGAAQVTGTTAGVSIDEVSSVSFITVDFGGGVHMSALVIDEAAEPCAPGEGPGERLVFALCDPDATPGTFTIVTEQAFPEQSCPGERITASHVEESESGTDLEEARSGSLLLEEIGQEVGDCATGSFDAIFNDDGELAGSFSAVVCPEVSLAR